MATDIIDKVSFLADDGDGDASVVRDEIVRAQEQGISTDGVRAMQNIENAILAHAVKLELIDTVDQRALERIREDRNLCVHPSVQAFGHTFEPAPEIARAHLMVALSALLTHPPTQGRKLFSTFIDFVSAPVFVPTAQLIQRQFYDGVRHRTRTSILKTAAKHALLELPAKVPLPASDVADRCAHVLAALSQRDRSQVTSALAAQRVNFGNLPADVQRRALGRLGFCDFFWETVDDTLTAHLKNLAALPSTTTATDLDPSTARIIALVGNDIARQRLDIESQFTALGVGHKMTVLSTQPTLWFVPTILDLLENAKSWRTGEQLVAILVKHAPFLTNATLSDAMVKCANNVQVWQAGETPPALASLLSATAHLGNTRKQVFTDFITTVRQASPPPEEYYQYRTLESLVANV